MTCSLCGTKVEADVLDHARLMHPDVMSLDGETYQVRMSLLKPVTQRMNDEDNVCESCDRQFVTGMLFGEVFEGMFGEMPIMSLVCGECFMGEDDS